MSSSGSSPYLRSATRHMLSMSECAMAPPFLGVKDACASASGTVCRRSSFAVTPMRSGEYRIFVYAWLICWCSRVC